MLNEQKVAGLITALALTQTKANSIYKPLGSFGDLMRMSYITAAANDPWNSPYMKAAQPWQPNTYYSQYSSCVNGGKLYTCVTSGASASSGGPTSVTYNTSNESGNIGTNTVIIASGGTGYVAGDVLTIVGGTAVTACQLTVTSVSSGVITTVYFSTRGIYTALPGAASACTGGTGTGATFTLSGSSVGWIYVGRNTVTSDPSLTQNAWVASTAYSLNTQVIASGNVYACVVAGTSSSTAPTGTNNLVVDNTVTWSYLGAYTPSPYTNNFPIITYQTNATGTSTYANKFSVCDGLFTAIAAYPLNSGAGYAVGDTITLTGGTFTTPSVLTVLTITAGGRPKSVSVTTAGLYTSLPTATVSQGSTSGGGSGATFAMQWSDPPWCSLCGCWNGGKVSSSGDNMNTYVFQPADNTTPLGAFYAMEFITDADKFYFKLVASSATKGLSLIIDGRRYSSQDLGYHGASTNVYFVDYTLSSGRKNRLYRFEAQQNEPLPSIYVDSNSQVWAPNKTNTPTAVLIGDSICASSSYGPFLAGNNVTQRLSHSLGWNVIPMVQGGTGWVNQGAGAGTTSNTFGYRIAQGLNFSPDVWIFFGSYNDKDYAFNTISTSVTAGLQAVRNGGSTAPIIVGGVWSVATATTTSELAIYAGINSALDPLSQTTWIPVANSPLEPWVTGFWNNNPFPSGISNANSTNVTIYAPNNPDDIHPTDIGTQYFAKRITDAIALNALPNIK